MKFRLHFGILVVLLAFLGTYLEHKNVPNQQIVIQFSDKEITAEDTENAIKVIQDKLQSIGISRIQIGQNQNGQLRISYYSESDVEHIQNVLFNTEDVNLAKNALHKSSHNFPEHKNIKDYQLNISEIKINNNLKWDFEGTQIVEINQKVDRFSYPKTNSSANYPHVLQSNSTIKKAILVSKTTAIAIDNKACSIPEVRAGPLV